MKGKLLVKFPYQLIDLTHTIDSLIPSWDGLNPFQCCLQLDYHQSTSGTQFRVQSMIMVAGVGTHIDAPAHCIPGGRTVDQLCLDECCIPCVVIDVSDRAHKTYTVSIEDIEMFERHYGQINRGDFVLIRTGWERFWHHSEQYRNNHIFPAVSEQVAHLLVARDIVGIGIDTLSPDRPDNDFSVHKILLGADKYIVENIAHSGQLPKRGAYVAIMPFKGKGLTEAPVRMIGLV